MPESMLQIKKYYYNKKGIKLDNIIEQVEHISTLSASILKADFVAVFYKIDGSDNFIPLAYHNHTDKTITDFEQLENKWTHPDVLTIGIDKKYFELSDNEKNKQNHKDLFAEQYDFKYYYQQPFFIDKQIKGVIFSYWLARPAIDINCIDERLIHLMNILNCSMLEANEIQLLSDYSLRLSELITMFEIPVGEYRFRELVSKLVLCIKKCIPKGNFCLFSLDNQTSSYKVEECFDQQPPALDFVSSVSKKLISLCEEVKKLKHLQGSWKDISDNFQNKYTVIKASPICMDTKENLVLVTWTDEITGFSQNDIELLTVFSVFAHAILNNASLVIKMSKANRLLQKTTDKFADVETFAALADMASGIAHDINNMIGGVVGRIQLMKLKMKDKDLLEKLNNIETLILSSAETVKRIQEFSISVTYKKLVKVNITKHIRDYLNKIDLKWRNKAKKKNIVINIKSSVNEAFIKGSEEDLYILLDKLIENGIDFAYDNTSIDIIISSENKYYNVSVRNKGSQIETHLKKKIFYPFYSTKDSQGAGLGLAIVYGIVARHGGKISLESNQHSGTVFTVKFPRPEMINEESEITRRQRKFENLKILIVDDDEQIREVLDDMLTIEGHNITTCSDGSSALKKFEEDTFDLLITDLGMPGMSGLELAGKIHKKNPDLPIAMITGWGTQLNTDEIKVKGIKAVLPKPFHLKDIKSLIHEIVIKD